LCVGVGTLGKTLTAAKVLSKHQSQHVFLEIRSGREYYFTVVFFPKMVFDAETTTPHPFLLFFTKSVKKWGGRGSSCISPRSLLSFGVEKKKKKKRRREVKRSWRQKFDSKKKNLIELEKGPGH